MLYLSTKSRYGLRALIDLICSEKEGPVSLTEIAKHQNISKKYLESIFRTLQKSGIITSRRGAGGGYQVRRNPTEISVLDIMIAIEGPLNLTDCLLNPSVCPRGERCPTKGLWADFSNTIETFLKQKTVQDLVDSHKENLRCLDEKGKS